MSEILYDWSAARSLSDWKFEGNGEMLADKDGALHVRTFNCGPLRRTSNAWLHKLDLPDAFEVEWSYRNGSETNAVIHDEGVMLVFNAQPVALKDLFEDPRPHARYSDLHSYWKMVMYTCGFFRTPYGGPDQLRKLGGKVPMTWGESNLTAEDGTDFQALTIVARADEPTTEADRGKTQQYKLQHSGNRIQFWCNGQQVIDWKDEGQYRYWREPLVGGKMAFRQFNGYMDNWYDKVLVRKL